MGGVLARAIRSRRYTCRIASEPKVIALLAALALVPAAAAAPSAPVQMTGGEAREIAWRFAQDWADLLDGSAHVRGCDKTDSNRAVCRFHVAGPTTCNVSRLIVWKSAPHTYYARARGVSCGH
jgi:hypothetical protein